MSYKMLTQFNHYDLFEVISALQKEIRRGNEKEALYWAYELCPKYAPYLWRRLIVILHEDIGLANPLLLAIVPRNRDLFFEFVKQRGQNSTARLVLINTILLMCRSAKSRLADHMGIAIDQERKHGLKLEIPDYALDKHTLRGKRMGRGMDHFLKDGTVLKPRASIEDVPDPYAAEAKKWWLGDDYIRGDSWGDAKIDKSQDGDVQMPLLDE